MLNNFSNPHAFINNVTELLFQPVFARLYAEHRDSLCNYRAHSFKEDAIKEEGL